MSYLVPSTSNSLQSAKQSESQRRSPHTASIDILDDDSLLNIFYLYRPFLFGEDGDDEARPFGGSKGWDLGHWWFKLSHVCQRWRNIILASSSYLGLCFVCTKGTPVADILAHPLPLPLVVDYCYEDSNMNAEDEEGLTLALEQRDRVRRIRLRIYMSNLQRLIVAINEVFPILEYLIIVSPDIMMPPGLALPETLQAPRLHHLMLSGFVLPIGSRLLTTATDLVTLVLILIIPSTYFHPNALLYWISFMPLLETLIIYFCYADSDPSRTIEGQSTRIPTTTPITLPNLRWFWFQGSTAYLEAVVRGITSPRLAGLQVFFFEQLTFSVPHLLQLMNTAETRNLRFRNAKLDFSSGQVDMIMFPQHEADLSRSLHIRVFCPHLDSQVSAMAQISGSLSQMFSAVEYLTLSYEAHTESTEGHDEVDRTEWRRIFRSFSNVKLLRIEDGLDKDIAGCLQLDDGEPLLDFLPELHELAYIGRGDTDHSFTPFINARQNAGRPVTLIHQSPASSPLENSTKTFPITSASSE